MREPEETERDRASRLAELARDHADDPGWTERFAPGTFGCHEALHLAAVLAQMVEESLAEHPAVALNPRWYELASGASDALTDLYQEIGRVHLDA